MGQPLESTDTSLGALFRFLGIVSFFKRTIAPSPFFKGLPPPSFFKDPLLGFSFFKEVLRASVGSVTTFLKVSWSKLYSNPVRLETHACAPPPLDNLLTWERRTPILSALRLTYTEPLNLLLFSSGFSVIIFVRHALRGWGWISQLSSKSNKSHEIIQCPGVSCRISAE